MSRKGFVVSAISIVAVVVVSGLFHYQVHIENALTHQQETGFGLEPSRWRTVFEPFLGLLLYFNRAFYAIPEFSMVLLWAIGIFVVYSLFRYLKKGNKDHRKRFVVNQLLNLPLLVGIWFALFVVLIFIELPNDRIVNKTSDWVLVTTHSHTEFSHDGLISEGALLRWHQRNGFDAFFITDHSNHGATLRYVNSRKGKEQAGGPVVFCGEEFSGSNHMSLLGLKTEFVTRGQTDSAVVARARADGAAVIVNHWFDGERKTLEYYKSLGVDGFEIENTATEKRYKREVYQRIKTYCEVNRLAMNGGLDFHGYGSACTLWNAFQIPEWKGMSYEEKQEAVLSIIKMRDQKRLKVLLLNDRPYYEPKRLFFSPLITLFNYFRTLNFFQVISWICWIMLFTFLKSKLVQTPALSGKYSVQRIGTLWAVAASLFLIALGLVYYSRVQQLPEFTKMYPEYGRLLLLAGFPLLIYSGILSYFRIVKTKTN